MKYCYFKTRNHRGFTLVELMVVLAVTAILAVLAGGGLIAYTRLARFQKNESNARAMFQTAQLAAAQLELAGEKDDFTALVAAQGNGGHITEPLTDTMTQEECDALNARVCALYFDKGAEPEENTPEGKLYAYIKDYVYDSSFLDAAFCIEIDASTGQVFSVFYDSGAQALRFADNKGQTDATLLDDRSYQNRRDQTLVGYYCADDAVNVVNLQQSKLRVRNQRLINGETLDVTWGGTSKSNETDTQYTVEIYSKAGDKKLFSVLVTLPAVNDPPKSLPVTLYDEHDNATTTENYPFPLRYANGSFVLTLDAMNDAAILQAHSKDANVAKTEFFSITRFVKDATNIYAKITAAPRAESVTSYTVSEGAITNTENSLYANATAELQCFRHLHNLRWYEGSDPLTARLTKDIDWLSGAPVVYCADGNKTAAKTPAADAPVAWPSLLELKEKVTLNGNRHTITGLQLRGNSVAKKDGCRYIGLVAENSGTIKNLTLADPDVLVNLTAETTGTYTVGGETLALMAADAKDYRANVRAVGALCGVSTGTVENCTVKRSKNRMATARVAASLTLDDTTTTYTRVKNADGKTIDNEPLGIGGLVGSAVPGSGMTLKDLTVEKNVTVAGIWQDGGTKATTAANDEAAERNRIEATDIDRAIGVGGVFGVLSLQDSCTVDSLNNAAEVCGNAYTGGVAGNLRGSETSKPTANNLNNTGSVLALAGYNGYTAGESRVLGQFFGGVAGMMKNAALTKSYSSTRSSLSENDVKTLIANGYGNGGTLSAASPLQGDFVGGLVGFGDGVTITDCKTGSGYVLGNTFVGGVVGGLSTGTVLNDGAANNSHVFGHRYVGGVVSFNGAGGSITGMSNTGMTAAFGANAAYAGGIVGYNAGKLTDCTAAASTNTATNASRVQLLQAMAKGYYADFVGGVAGYNADTITWTKDAAVSTLLNGGSFVGGVVGFNDADATISVADSAALTVSGRITGAQDAVGGLVGLNSGTTLPAVTVKAELISGRYCVGGVLGANVVAKGMTATGLCTGGSGNSLQATALAGGIVGYNQVIQTMPTAENTITRAKGLLPKVTDSNNILTVSEKNNEGTATVTLNNCANALNLTADAYVGGVVGWGENLELNNAVNGAQNSVSMGVLRSDGSLQVTCQAVTGNAAGGIIGYAGGSTRLNGCQNFAGVFHKQMAGGIAGYNAGTIENCTQNANLGTRQAGYKYIGGIAGVNAGTIQAGKPQSVTVSGEQAVGGVAGLNAQNGTIQAITNCTVTVQGSQAVGGVAGANQGTVQGSTLQTVNVAASGSNAGGAVGQNSGTVQNVTVQGGSVQGSQAVGGLAGDNGGSVEGCTTASALTVRADQNAGAAVGSNAQNAVVSAGSYAGTVYAASGYAGGMAGQNAGNIENAATSAAVTCENGDAGGVTAVNSESGTIDAVLVDGCTVNSGSANMGAVAAVNNGTIQGVTVQKATLQGGAAVIGGIAGWNKGRIVGTETSACKVEQNALTLSGLTAADITLGGAAGQNEKDAIINKVQVALNVTDKLEKYRTLGGVAGVNNGTLQNCVFTAGQLGETITNDAPATVGAAKVGDAIGGVAGVNNATVTGCTVWNIRINMLGITNVESSQDVATKLDNASHVGGIVGRNSNKGTIQDSTIGTEEGSAVIAKFGFVGGIAGSNAGEISGCGGQGTKDAVNQIKIWLGGGETGIDEMITQLQYGITKNNAGEVTSQDTAFNDLRGVDAVRDGTGGYAAVYTTGLAENQLTVALRGSATKRTEEAAGYLGGVTGYNTNTGVISETATGKWFVYCDNGNVDNAVIGGMIGQNESDKDMTNLLNCAAVRRFNRTKDNTEGNDDAQNSNNQHVENAGVGGVIGVQQNRSGDRWSLTNVVNYGTVHNSRSNRMAGVICLWLDNGGTLEHCFNFGTLYANSNSGVGSSGTAGGIVAVFDKPVSGGTTNLVSCQNHGYIWSENKRTANDVGGILGMVRMKNHDDYLIINISDCVVGDIGMRAGSQTAGMIAWLASADTQALNNVYVNIDRCRNYCIWIQTFGSTSGGSDRKIGIAGDRVGDNTAGATTISACFVLYNADSDNYAIACNTGSQNVQTYAQNHALLPNFYMDRYSFAGDAGSDRVRGLEGLAENALGSTLQQDTTNNDYPACTDSGKIYGYRLYAGSNITAGNYFAAQIPAEKPEDMTGSTAYLREIYPANSKIDTTENVIVGNDGNQQGKLMFTFAERDNTSSPSKKDINDAAVRKYYTEVLDAQYDMNATVEDIKAVRSDDTSGGTSIYGRYRVTWKAVPGASHYKVTVMVREGETYKEMPDLPTATVYTNQYTFEAPQGWLGKQYIVEITPCNSKVGKATRSDTGNPFIFAKTLPTPQLEMRVFEDIVKLYVKNIDDYEQIDKDWAITPSMTGGWNWSPRYSDMYDNNHFAQQATSSDGKGYIGHFTIFDTERTFSLRASAKTKKESVNWMQSAQYNVQTYTPKYNFVGLGKLTMKEPVLTGTTADGLTIATDLSISGQTYNPKYRIMLQGKPKDKTLTSVKGNKINDAYVTLQAVETVLSGSATRVTFTDLPAYVLTDYSDWRILAAPVNTGVGDTTCRWEYQQGINQYRSSLEYVREANGTYTEYSMSTLYNIDKYDCTVAKDITLNVLPAPTLSDTATPTLDSQKNLLYTFTWDNVPDAESYTYKLYGKTENGEVEINLPAGAATLKTDGAQPTLTVTVDKLTNGAADWHFATVRLAVTSVPKTGSTNTVGATASREYTDICTRLTKPGAPNSILLTNNADAETLPYEITWTGIPDSALDHYELLAGYEDSSGNWQTTETWTGTTKDASLTVNLEKYQGKTLHLRVVAVPADENGAVRRSPYSATSSEFTVVTRETAPTVSKVEFTNPTPKLDEFLNKLQVQFTVNSGSSHYVTGYLFKDKNDYDAVVNLVNAWNIAKPDNKAAALKALQEKLAVLLANETETKAVCLIPEGSRTIGLPAETKDTAETTDKTVQYTLTPDKFAMQPQYGGWYLLPAVRTMTTEQDKACSVWTYYTTAAGLQVPCIRLDTPVAVRSTSQYTGKAIISDTPGAASGTADAQVEVQRVAVQWSADNLYTAADTMLANVYEVTVTPTTGNGNPYTLRITVQPKDEYQQDESGNTVVKTARGAVLKVEKTVDGINYSELEANDGSWVLDTTQTTLTGTILQEDSLQRYYTMQVQPMLQYNADTKTYSLILPDLAKAVYEDPNETSGSQLTPYTDKVQITAKGEDGFAAVQPSEAAVINPQQTN